MGCRFGGFFTSAVFAVHQHHKEGGMEPISSAVESAIPLPPQSNLAGRGIIRYWVGPSNITVTHSRIKTSEAPTSNVNIA